ncbi:MAG: chromosome segregation protein SMC [Rubrobacteridae bacterium]|nr:chromosome segregation protein SMC [Rubrobacteridae bacterium]
MYLKSLTLRGFKSFADRTVLRFENGVTGIVGPNGSGKSNISEAVMWVLGEQSARSLRSGSMEDVIFAGSSSRPALGMVEVSLSFSNNDGILPIEFSEVTITRRLYRSGESDYYINNSPCRLLDIQDLLSDSGLGKGLYSIIGQGRLEEILNSKPEEKMMLLEEAAGIIKHKKRRDRALKRLSSMDQNLQRAKDISVEITRQLKPLRTQANKTRQFNDLSDELRSLDIGLAVFDLKDLQDDWEKTIFVENDLKERIADLKQELSARHEATEKLQLEFETKNFYSGDISEKRRKLQSVEDKVRSGIDLLEEKGKNIEQRIAEVRYAINQSDQRKNKLTDQRRWLEKEKSSLVSDIEQHDQLLEKFEKQFTEINEKRKAVEDELGNLKLQLQAEGRASDNCRAESANLNVAIHNAENQLNFYNNELESLTKKRMSIYQQLDEKKRDLEIIGIEVTGLEFQVNDLEMSRTKLQNEFDQANKKENELRQYFAGVKARIEALKDIVDSFPTTEDITGSFKSYDSAGIIGLVKDVIKVRPEYEKAIEAALGADIFCVALENSEVLQQIASNKNDYDSINLTSFVPNDKARAKPPTNDLFATVWALDVVSYPETYKHTINALLSHVYIASDFNAASSLQEKLEDQMMVTMDGEILLPNGKVIFGAASEAIGILGYQRELEELADKLDEYDKAINKENTVQNELKARINSINQQKEIHSKQLRSKMVQQSNFKQSIKDLEPELSRVSAKVNSMTDRVKTIEKRFTDDKEKLTRLNHESRAQKDKVFNLQFRFDELQKDREAFLNEEMKLKIDMGKIRADLNSLNDRSSHNTKRLTGVTRELENFDTQNDTEREFLDHLKKLFEKIPLVKTAHKQLLTAVSFRHDQISEMTLFEEGSLEDLRQELRQGQIEINKLSDLAESTMERLHEAELRKAQLELKVTSAVQKVVDEYDVPLEKALEQGIAVPREEAESRASALRRKIAALGPINPIAIEEFEQLQERHRVFTEQMEDLQRGRRALMKVINAIELKMKDCFVETFEKVNEGFQHVFESLFPGGHAELVMTDPDDIYNSGVDIAAQPSGKRLQRISLLSGGEKSLVALAFSFALYQIKPSPFYILDEVEAALDDINLQRFIALLIRLKLNSQVLIITHQRRTMEVCDTLYGVSMQADGVSRLISQKFSEVTLV